jgi:hypothetical protein
MNGVFAVMVSNRTVEAETERGILELTRQGARIALFRGFSDVALARCISLTAVCRELRNDEARDVVLMLDDDMHFTLEQARRVVDSARAAQRPVSAAYCTEDGRLAAYADPQLGWLVGLGFIAIPRVSLLELEQASVLVNEGTRTECRAFCWSGPHGDRWEGEDWCLSRRLGGVELLSTTVGHIKKRPLYPIPSELERILAERRSEAAE